MLQIYPLLLISPLLKLLQDPRVLQMLREPCPSSQSDSAVGWRCDTEPGTVQGSLQPLEGPSEPGSVPRTPRGRGQGQVAPPGCKQPSLPARPGWGKQLQPGGKSMILNGKHPQKSFTGTSPASLRVCDPSVASLADSSPQQQVLSPGQAGMSPQPCGGTAAMGMRLRARGVQATPKPRGGRRKERGGRGCTHTPKRCHPGRARPATRHRPGQVSGCGSGGSAGG